MILIYHTPGGRLGNQLFEMAIVEDLMSVGDVLLVSRIDELLNSVDLKFRYKHLSQGFLYRIIDKVFIRFVLRPLIHKFKLFTLVKECNNQGSYKLTRGIFRKIVWIEGYFQGEVFWKKTTKNFTFKPAVKLEAKSFIAENLPANKTSVAIHWRKGDYKDFQVFGELDPSLPLSYFKKAIEMIRQQVPNAHFFLFSDDPDHIETQLELSADESTVSRNRPSVDLAMMSLCQHAIISNSTLAWWGGYLNSNHNKIVIAPKYWLGWKKQQWFPEGIQPSFAQWLDV